MPSAPPKPKRRPRAGRLAIRMSDDERSLFQQKATDAGSPSLAAYLRECVLQSQVIARPKPSPERARVLFLVNKTSNNINQLAHQVNTAAKVGLIAEDTYTQLLDRLADIALFMKIGLGHVD